jgi:K+-sensing histidine kinase KdpD
MNKKPKTLILFYVLVAYILLQFGWWAFLLTSLTSEVFLNKEAELSSKYLAKDVPVSEIEFIKKKQQSRIAMILGEGSVFILLLAIGIYRVKKSLEKETALAKQQKNFMLSVTHELKTPLAAIKLNLQTIQKRKLEKEKQNELLNNSISESDRLNMLIENVLLAARIENSEYNFYQERINISEFINKQLAITFNSLRVEKTIQDNIFVIVDSLALASLITNLVENALKYSDAKISVVLELKNGKVLLEIRDLGPGIPTNEKENIFNKFYRIGNEETRKTKGTGLGLFISKYIADKQGIKISVHENKPSGSVFRLIFLDLK